MPAITVKDEGYQWAAQLLVGRSIGVAGAMPGSPSVLDTVVREGVVSLVWSRLAAGNPGLGAEPGWQDTAMQARLAAARSLQCQAQARAVQQALDAAGIPCLWLKGLALGQWLYPSAHLRDIADIDLLVPDHASALRAAAVLEPLGYSLPNPHIAGDLVVHELMALNERARLELDLHWDLSNSALFADRLTWQELVAASISLPGLSPNARGLGPEHALLHACMHRAINALTHRQDRLRWLYDIHLLAECFDQAQWQAVVDVASRTRLADATHDGLQASQGVFGTSVPVEVLQMLATAARTECVATRRLGSWTYYQRQTWRVLPDTPARIRWLRQLLFPDMAHLRMRYGEGGVIAVLWRRLLDGFRRWRGYVVD